MARPSHPQRLDYSNWRRVQIMKLTVMQFSPLSVIPTQNYKNTGSQELIIALIHHGHGTPGLINKL
jgi:hypothetical protein